jgi:hypothetical protein
LREVNRVAKESQEMDSEMNLEYKYEPTRRWKKICVVFEFILAVAAVLGAYVFTLFVWSRNV